MTENPSSQYEIKLNDAIKNICHLRNVSRETARREVHRLISKKGRFVLELRKRTWYIVEKSS